MSSRSVRDGMSVFLQFFMLYLSSYPELRWKIVNWIMKTIITIIAFGLFASAFVQKLPYYISQLVALEIVTNISNSSLLNKL